MGQLFVTVLFLAAIAHCQRTSLRTFFVTKGDADSVSCQQQRRVGPKGKISSPGYPLTYPNHTSCSWYIIGRANQVITISFDDLDLGGQSDCESTQCCEGTWIKLGPTPSGGERVYCGRSVPEPFLSTTSSVWIKFHTTPTQASHGRGFQFTYTVGGLGQVSCKPDEFSCLNGKCILQRWACNGRTECEDSSDERFFCTCGEGDVRCATGPGCYLPEGRCDGRPDCADYSDELDCSLCGPNRTLCSPTSVTCYDPIRERCDSIIHCENGEDEQGCVLGCEQKIMCSSGVGCYRSLDRCDGIPHCVDRSDESGCGPDKCRSERGTYLCTDGRCIPEDSVCDHVSDCPDGSDEEGCLRNSMITAAIIGSLFCGLLVVVAVSCSCRLYALRLAQQRQQMSAAERLCDSAPPLFADGAPADFWFREPPPPYAVAVGEHRYHLPPEGVAVYGGGPQGDLCGGPSMPRGSQRRTRRLRRHRQRLVTTSHDFESSGEALPPPPRFDNSVVLSVNPSGPPRRKVSADSTRSEETGVMVSVGTALAGDVVMVSCDDTRPLIDDDEQTT